MKKYVMEFIGAFFLILTIGLSGNALAIGLTLAVMIYIGGHVSGGHYNPAVTLAVWMRGKLPGREVVQYWISQLLGATAAAFCVYFLVSKTFGPSSSISAGVLQMGLAETLFTFVLASTVLTVATTKKLDGNYVYGLAIGFAVTVGAYAIGSISGGAMNPAVGVGPLLVGAIIAGQSLANLWIYIVFPLIGGALAALVFNYLNPSEK